MVILELFAVLSGHVLWKSVFKVLTGGLRLKLPLGGMWNMERWKKKSGCSDATKKTTPSMTMWSEWESDRKGDRSRAGFMSWFLQLFESDTPTEGQVQSTWRSSRATRQEVSPFLVHRLEFQRYPRTLVFLWKGWTVMFLREFPELMTYSS